MIQKLLALASLVLAISLSSAQAAETPDRIFVNAKVWTADPASPAADSFAVAGARFVAVGTESAMRQLAGTRTTIIDLRGRRVVPGFIDAHWHLPSRRSARLDNAGSVEVIQQRLAPPGARELPSTAHRWH